MVSRICAVLIAKDTYNIIRSYVANLGDQMLETSVGSVEAGASMHAFFFLLYSGSLLARGQICLAT